MGNPESAVALVPRTSSDEGSRAAHFTKHLIRRKMHAATHDELFDAREARGTVAALVPANGRSRSMARALASGRNVAFLRAERVLPHMSVHNRSPR